MYIIIFLDIDGVIYSHKGIDLKDHYDDKFLKDNDSLILYDKVAVKLFDEEALYYLNLLIETIRYAGYECGIVLSTDWKSKGDIGFLKELFKQHIFSKYIIDKTIDKDDRWEEINLWLKENKYSNYVVLDDLDMSDEFPNNFVLCDDYPNKLFKVDEYYKCVNILFGNKNEDYVIESFYLNERWNSKIFKYINDNEIKLFDFDDFIKFGKTLIGDDKEHFEYVLEGILKPPFNSLFDRDLKNVNNVLNNIESRFLCKNKIHKIKFGFFYLSINNYVLYEAINNFSKDFSSEKLDYRDYNYWFDYFKYEIIHNNMKIKCISKTKLNNCSYPTYEYVLDIYSNDGVKNIKQTLDVQLYKPVDWVTIYGNYISFRSELYNKIINGDTLDIKFFDNLEE